MGYTLRVSVLDACQLRCRYCLPNAIKPAVLKNSWLSLSAYKKIALALKPLGIEKIRFTGGEPLLRPDLPEIIRIFSQSFKNTFLALTTNGLQFSALKQELVDAGLVAVTFHLDTLKKDRYGTIMGPGSLEAVLRAIDEALKLKLKVKINIVVQKGINDDELIDFLQFSKKNKIEIRFIEQMNTGSARDYVHKTFISGQDILRHLGHYSLIMPVKRPSISDPAEQFLAQDLGVVFGLIASDTRPFCSNCNRLRLSADGHLRTCLYEPQGQPLDSSIDEAALVKRITSIVAHKTSFHPSIAKERRSFSMSQIGG